MNSYHDFAELTDEEQRRVLNLWYNTKLMSVPEIAEMLNTYPNKIKRQATKIGFQLRNKSESQKVALKTGKLSHPTKGKQRSLEVKNKISEKKAEFWNNIDEKDKKEFCKKQKENWENLSDEKKAEIRDLATRARLQTSKDGSKLEKAISDKLIEAGYYVEFHKEQSMSNERIHLDMMLPNERIVIEIDGPSHFEPIWGQEILQKTQKTDKEKDGLVMNAGYCIIRVRQKQSNVSMIYINKIFTKLLSTIKEIEKKFPPLGQRRIIL